MTPDRSAPAVALPAALAAPADRARPDMRLLGLLALGHMVSYLVGFAIALFLPEPRSA